MSTIRLAAWGAALALASSLAAPIGSAGAASTSDEGPRPGPAHARAVGANGGVWAPENITVSRWRGEKKVWIDPVAHLVAGTSPIEIHTQRPDYATPIRTTWHRGSTSGAIAVTQKDLRKLYGFLRVTVKTPSGTTLVDRTMGSCLATAAYRSGPDAAATSPFPDSGCAWTPFALGMVQGVQAGWAVPLMENGLRVETKESAFDVTVTLAAPYADALGIAAADRTATTHVKVRTHGGGQPGPIDRAQRDDDGRGPDLGPEPRKAAAGDPTGNEPDLRALPVTALDLDRKGTLLRFQTDVWNAGPGALVLEGFRNASSSTMTGYQQFYAADGTSVGHVRLGPDTFRLARNGFEWRNNVLTSYRLVDSKGRVVAERSRSTQCGGGLDIVDLTLPRAVWRPYESTDSMPNCGGGNSLSLREVIPVGYTESLMRWSRAEAIDVSKLPKGWYTIEVRANPTGVITETSGANNTSSRRIWLGPAGQKRQLKVPQVGLVADQDVHGSGR